MIEGALKRLIKLAIYGASLAVGAVLVVFGVQNKHQISNGGISVDKVYADAPGDATDGGDSDGVDGGANDGGAGGGDDDDDDG